MHDQHAAPKTDIQIAQEAKIRPILGLPPPVEDEVFEKDLGKFRRWIKKFALEKKFAVIDFYRVFFDPKKKKIFPGYFEDGVHPSMKGYQAMAQAAVKILKGL